MGAANLELRVPPPAVALAVAFAMWLAAGATSAFRVQLPARSVVALALAIAGVLAVGAGLLEFRRARTTINPLDPGAASAIVVSGIYRFTRNPMYLGFAAILLAFAAYLGNPLSLLGVAGFVAYMNRFQITPEERALQALFPGAFDAYAKKVSRWL